MIVAAYADSTHFAAAVADLRAASLTAETYTPGPPAPPGPDATASPLPAIMLAVFILAAGGFLGLQIFADTVAYPIDVGGRPNNSWPAFIANAFEFGVLCAMVAGVFGFVMINRLPRFHDPIDRAEPIRRASRDLWCVTVRGGAPDAVRDLLARHHPHALDQVPD